MCSTPTVDAESRIQKAWIESDQRENFVPCPMCNHYQVLVLGDGTGGGLVWREGEPEKVAYCCENCRQLIPHLQKSWMVERGEYRPQNSGSRSASSAESMGRWRSRRTIEGIAIDS